MLSVGQKVKLRKLKNTKYCGEMGKIYREGIVGVVINKSECKSNPKPEKYEVPVRFMLCNKPVDIVFNDDCLSLEIVD